MFGVFSCLVMRRFSWDWTINGKKRYLLRGEDHFHLPSLKLTANAKKNPHRNPGFHTIKNGGPFSSQRLLLVYREGTTVPPLELNHANFTLRFWIPPPGNPIPLVNSPSRFQLLGVFPTNHWECGICTTPTPPPPKKVDVLPVILMVFSWHPGHFTPSFFIHFTTPKNT